MSEVQPTEEVAEQEMETPEEIPGVEEAPTEVEEPQPELEPEETQEPAKPAMDYKKRFHESSSEAMILLNQNKNQQQQLQSLTTPDPTEAELREANPDWDTYNDIAKKFAKDLLATRKQQQAIALKQMEDAADRQWQSELRKLTSDAQYAELRNEPAFEDFVFKSQHKGVDLQVLADAYMVRTGRINPVTDVESQDSPQTKKPKQAALPRGSGGPRTPDKPRKLSIEEAVKLRETNNKEYMRLLKAGAIDDEI